MWHGLWALWLLELVCNWFWPSWWPYIPFIKKVNWGRCLWVTGPQSEPRCCISMLTIWGEVTKHSAYYLAVNSLPTVWQGSQTGWWSWASFHAVKEQQPPAGWWPQPPITLRVPPTFNSSSHTDLSGICSCCEWGCCSWMSAHPREMELHLCEASACILPSDFALDQMPRFP